MRRASTVNLRNTVTRIRRGRKAQGRRYPADLRQKIVAHAIGIDSSAPGIASHRRGKPALHQPARSRMRPESTSHVFVITINYRWRQTVACV